MTLFGISPRLRGLRLLLAALLLGPVMVLAQEQATPTPVDQAEKQVPSPGDAGAALREVERLVTQLDQAALVGDLGERLDSAEQRLSDELAGRLQQRPIDEVDRGRLDSVLRLLLRYRSALASFQREVDEAIAVADATQESLRQTEGTWTKIRNNTDREDLPPELADLIDDLSKATDIPPA